MSETYVGAAESRYSELLPSREPFLKRARECSVLTIPSLIPPEGHSGSSTLVTPFQALGARGVNNLAAKMLLALLPPSAPFFRLKLAPAVEEIATAQEKSEVESVLAQQEKKILGEIEDRETRVYAYEAYRHLIVGGNVLIHFPSKKSDKKKTVRVFPLAQYVVCRDPEGNVLEIVVKESVTPASLPHEIQAAVKARLTADVNQRKDASYKSVSIFTYIKKSDERWTVYQEVKGLEVPGSRGSYPLDKSPWLPLRWTRIDGEDYGRGHCEEYIGDLYSLEGLEKALVEAAAQAARVLNLVKPNGMTDIRDVAEAPNGAYRPGDPEDVKVVQQEKYGDFQVAQHEIQKLEQRLSYAFLMNSAVQRQGERVTAEEIRYMASELEDALGGVYSIMSSEFQLPLVRVVMTQMEQEDTLPKLPQDSIKITITTGMDALGRSHESMRLRAWLTGVLQLYPDAGQQVNWNEYMKRTGSAEGIDIKGLIKSPEELAQENQQAQMQAMAEKGIGPAINMVSANSIAAAQTKEPVRQ